MSYLSLRTYLRTKMQIYKTKGQTSDVDLIYYIICKFHTYCQTFLSRMHNLKHDYLLLHGNGEKVNFVFAPGSHESIR